MSLGRWAWSGRVGASIVVSGLVLWGPVVPAHAEDADAFEPADVAGSDAGSDGGAARVDANFDTSPSDTMPFDEWDGWDAGETAPQPTCESGMQPQQCYDGINWACLYRGCFSDAECPGQACIQRLARFDSPVCTDGQIGPMGAVACDTGAAAGAAKAPPGTDVPVAPPDFCQVTFVCGDLADDLCPNGLFAQICSPTEPVQCGLQACNADTDCRNFQRGAVCRGRYTRTSAVACANGGSLTVTNACTLGEADCAGASVCVMLTGEDTEGGPEVVADFGPDTAPDFGPDTGTAEPIIITSVPTDACDAGGSGLGLGLFGVLTLYVSRRPARMRRLARNT